MCGTLSLPISAFKPCRRMAHKRFARYSLLPNARQNFSWVGATLQGIPHTQTQKME
jgi:hypothetical protein